MRAPFLAGNPKVFSGAAGGDVLMYVRVALVSQGRGVARAWWSRQTGKGGGGRPMTYHLEIKILVNISNLYQIQYLGNAVYQSS